MANLHLLLIGVILLIAQSSSSALPVEVKLSINTTTIEINNPFKATCTIVNADEVKDKNYKVKFMVDDQLIATYDKIQFTRNMIIDSLVDSLNSNFPVFEVAITPKSNKSLSNFWCDFIHDMKVFSSNHLFANHNTSLHFSANVTKVENDKPFIMSCRIANFDDTNKNYSIKFFRASTLTKILLGTHEIKAPTVLYPKQRQIFIPESFNDLTVHSGPNFAFPNFEILITPKPAMKKDNFWCELADETTDKTYESNVWASIPIVEFSIPVKNYPFTARCDIVYFNPEGATFSVVFMQNTDSIASFNYKANQSEEFIHKVGTGDTKVLLGESFTYPRYEVIITPKYQHNYRYWCALLSGAGNIQEFKSNNIYY